MAEYVCELPVDGMASFVSGSTTIPVHERIVRCRDCRYARILRPFDLRTRKPSTVIEEWYCEWHSNPEGASDIEPDGFCKWGEKRRES